VNEQLLLSLPAGDNVQLAAGTKLPLPELENVTVPPGLEAPLPAVSLTFAVQELPTPTRTGEPQISVVEVVRRSTGTALPPELAPCTLLPP
jgi:hypothetical protein